jgi:hypothetical protein
MALWFCEKCRALANGFLGGEKRFLRVREPCGSLQGKCMYRYPGADDESKGVIFTLIRKAVSRVWSFGSGIGGPEKERHNGGGSQFEDMFVFWEATVAPGVSLNYKKQLMSSNRITIRSVSNISSQNARHLTLLDHCDDRGF